MPFFRYADINALILNEEDADCLDYKYYRTVDMMTDVSWEGSEATSGGKIPIHFLTLEWSRTIVQKLESLVGPKASKKLNYRFFGGQNECRTQNHLLAAGFHSGLVVLIRT